MVSKTPLKPRLSDLMGDYVTGRLNNAFFSMPGKVFYYSAAAQTAQVEIMLQYTVDGIAHSYPLLVDVPVFMLRGGKGGINLVITKGDPCLVIFADRDIDNWFSTGSAQLPNTQRIHSLADGFALVGFSPQTGLTDPPDYLATGIYNDATQISIKSNKAAIKNGTTDLLTLLQGFCDAVISALGTATPSPATVQAGSTPLSVSFTTTAVTNAKTALLNLLYQGDETTP